MSVSPTTLHVTGGEDSVVPLSPGLMDVLRELRPVDERTFNLGEQQFGARKPKRHDITQLQRTLYELYQAGRPVRSVAVASHSGFVSDLVSSHCVQSTLESGWRVVIAESEDSCMVEKDGLRVWVDRHRHVVGGVTPGIGSMVSLRLPPSRPNISAGFLTVVSGKGLPDTPVLGRFYCNLKSSAVGEFLERTTSYLERLGLRYSIKTLNRPEDYGRWDGTVVYAPLEDEQSVAGALSEITFGLKSKVNEQTPAFALKLRPGLAFAQEPVQEGAQKVSFGQHRCQILAEALLETRGQLYADTPTAATLISEKLKAGGIDPLRPYRNWIHVGNS